MALERKSYGLSLKGQKKREETWRNSGEPPRDLGLIRARLQRPTVERRSHARRGTGEAGIQEVEDGEALLDPGEGR